jgi:hypothetical protein
VKIADFRLLKKLMNMTQSGSDAEILTALRRANEILARSGTTWDRVLDRVVQLEVEAAPTPRGPAPRGEGAEDLSAQRRRNFLEELLGEVESAELSGTMLDFVESVRRQFDDRGDLSVNQVEALERVRARERDRGSAQRRSYR